jgi:hypothetical protein
MYWDAKYPDDYNWCKWIENDFKENVMDESENENEMIEYALR